MRILTTSEIRATDAYTIVHEPIASIDLMERAASACFEWIRSLFDKFHAFRIICGTGNNGGDGLAIARMMAQEEYDVQVYVLRNSNQPTADFLLNEQRLNVLHPGLICRLESEKDFPVIQPNDVVVDAIFGTGLSRPADGLTAAFIERINASNAIVIAIDMPSGLYADAHTDPVQPIIRATTTLSFQVPKLAFFFAENHPYVGNWELLDIGLDRKFIDRQPSKKNLIVPEFVKTLLKPRSKFSHKGTFGHALLIAGSYGKMGAAVLAAKACLRSGAGLLTVHLPQCGTEIMQTAVPEAMVDVDADEKIYSSNSMKGEYSAIGIGCGIGLEEKTQGALKQILSTVKVPLVLDADAINILALNKNLLDSIPENAVLTPHPKEFERITSEASDDFHRHELQVTFAMKYHVTVVLKGAHTCIACPDGTVYFNTTGNSGMAKGGSGDALTGIILAFLAQGYSPQDASILGVYFHGAAGDIAAANKSMQAMVASDLIECLGNAFLEINSLRN